MSTTVAGQSVRIVLIFEATVSYRYAFTSPVGNFPESASPYGVLDMAGNVWEWVSDLYDPEDYSRYLRCLGSGSCRC